MSGSNSPSNSKYILIVDDDNDNLSSLRMALETEGHHVSTASDGQQALEFLRSVKHLPDIILLDLMMPRMNGWEFNKERQRDPRLAGIPIIVVTAMMDAKDAAEPIKPVAILQKPIMLERLLITIEKN